MRKALRSYESDMSYLLQPKKCPIDVTGCCGPIQVLENYEKGLFFSDAFVKAMELSAKEQAQPARLTLQQWRIERQAFSK